MPGLGFVDRLSTPIGLVTWKKVITLRKNLRGKISLRLRESFFDGSAM